MADDEVDAVRPAAPNSAAAARDAATAQASAPPDHQREARHARGADDLSSQQIFVMIIPRSER